MKEKLMTEQERNIITSHLKHMKRNIKNAQERIELEDDAYAMVYLAGFAAEYHKLSLILQKILSKSIKNIDDEERKERERRNPNSFDYIGVANSKSDDLQ